MTRSLGLTVAFAICITFSTAQIPRKNIKSVHFDNCSDCVALVQASDTIKFNKWIKTQPAKSIKRLGPGLFKVSAPASTLNNLKNIPGVQYVDKGSRRPHPETILGRFDITANSVAASKAFYPNINGDGATISIKEERFFEDDVDLKGR